MDFATLPPEINSGLMYSGPGAGSIIRAAAAWDALAARLFTAAADYRAVTAKLAGAGEGPDWAALTDAAAPYVDWLDTVAARSACAATALTATAGAHQSAFTATVPPSAIAANRTRRLSLAATNCLGQHSTVIADVDAEYDAMWAQNTGAMYAYARGAARAAAIAPFPEPPGDPAVANGNWALQSAPDVISSGGKVMAVIPDALDRLLSSPPAPIDASLSSVTAPLSKLNSMTAPSDFAIAHLNSVNKTAALRSLFRKPAAISGVRAGFDRATPVGALSVPRAWAPAAPALDRSIGDRTGEPVRLVAISPSPGPHAANELG
ncbi:PPE family protein [Mycobacterium arosiense]|uniref:PPE family protein n=1 Tax=Mycobacterium arosiense ATCC BAA-1401 = DSM 45069 TaxID=1265311 RepID=A0A1W9ZDZ7_MYCAI|nr:PPE family protein [Mycobacterium arosiense]ORA13104.1 PPE family protein [Mycobacterium arosiense ATCC BAA-1401 = DSM 45069]